jgi:hypothetical protein
MIVLVIHRVSILADESKSDTPVAANFHGPITFTLTAQFMETQTGEVHILRAGGRLKAAKDKAQSSSVPWLNTSLAALGEETLQPLVFESRDHACTVT